MADPPDADGKLGPTRSVVRQVLTRLLVKHLEGRKSWQIEEPSSPHHDHQLCGDNRCSCGPHPMRGLPVDLSGSGRIKRESKEIERALGDEPFRLISTFEGIQMDLAQPLVVGNWKMNGDMGSLQQIARLVFLIRAAPPRCSVAICPPVTLLRAAAAMASPEELRVGAQDCHEEVSGAYTGDVSAEMLAEAGAKLVIVGHSERRNGLGETSTRVRAKAAAALRAGLAPIICVGETQTDRETGQAETIVSDQLQSSVPDTLAGNEIAVAYEPVWAIGTGKTPTPNDIAKMHARLRRDLVDRFAERGATIPILYGGSLKPTNAKEILSITHVNGGLVGGASLHAADFFGIISAA